MPIHMSFRRLALRFLFSSMFVMMPMPTAASAVEESPAGVPTQPATAPAGLPDDLTVWPNKVSYRNSEPWIRQNHDKIREMRPRVLVLNFANDVDMPGIQERTEKLINALAESTRYHGFKDPDAPAFLKYEVLKYIDMRDRPAPSERLHKNSAFLPLKPDGPQDFGCDYSTFYGDAFARFYGFQDPRNSRRYFNLHELINSGVVHELWFYAIHDEDGWPAFEVIELKQYYDDQCRPIEGKHGPAGNGHDDSMPWSGRSFRMAFFNPHRGTGCQMENFGHGLEAYANHDAIGYWRRYFREFAELDLDKRFEMPFRSLYEMSYGDRNAVTYPSATSMKAKYHGREYTMDPYVAIGGNAHWPPGARHHYDLDSPHTVKSTIENYRLRNGADGQDKVLDFNKEKYAPYRKTVPDCMGAWMVFWRQCMPGLDNQCVDDDGKPMKNWWVFLFY